MQNDLLKHVNATLCETLGYTLEELVDTSFVQYVAPEYQKLAAERYAHRMQGQDVPNLYELVMVTKDGRRIPVEIAVALFTYQGQPASMGTIRDISQRKEAETKVREHEAMLETFFNVTHDLVGILNPDDETVVYANDALAQSLGQPKSNLIGVRYTDLAPLGMAESRLAKARETARTKQPIAFNDERNGRQFENRFYPIMDDQGTVKYVAGFIRDITEEQEMQQQLQESEKKYATLVEQGNDGVMVAQDGLLKYANQMLFDTLGYTPEEVVDTPFIRYIAPQYREMAAERFTRRMQGLETPPMYELELVAKNGSYIPVEVHAAVIEYQGKPASMAVVRDITKRKQAEQRIQSTIDTMLALLNTTTDMAFLVDTEAYRVIDCNEAFCRSLERKRDQIIGTQFKDLLPPDIYASRVKKGLECITKKHLVRFEDSRAGRWFDICFYPLVDENGNVPVMAGYVRDITEEKQMRERLMEQEKLAALGQIAAVIAHELNTPLATIDLTAQMLTETLPDTYSADLDTIKQEVTRASRLVKETLGFTRMETLHLQKTRIKPILETALKRQQSLHDTTHITFDVDITDAPIRADDDKLAIALENIIKNAIQAQQTPQAKHHIAIHTTPDTENLTITIRDTGVGMDDHTINNLFKPFFTTRDKTEGTGLGLYITHWITTNHQGSITAASTEGEGTTFTITLPVES